MSIKKPLHPIAAMPNAAEVAKAGEHDGVHALGKDTVTGWKPFAGNDQLKMPATFGPGPDDTKLEYDELVNHSEAQVGVRFVMFVDKTE